MTYHAIPFKEISYTFIRDVTNSARWLHKSDWKLRCISCMPTFAVPHFLTDRDLLHVLVGILTC